MKYSDKVKKSTLIKIGLGFLLLLIGIYSLKWTPLHQYTHLDKIIPLVEKAQHSSFAPIVFFFIFSFGVLLLPITLFPIIGGVLFPFWFALPLNAFAATFGAWIAFNIARFFGREAVEPLLKGKLHHFDTATASKGFKTVFILRIVGIPPFIVANYALGLTKIRNRDYLSATIFGILPWMTFITYFASSFWNAVLAGGERGLTHAVISKMGPISALSIIILIVVAISFFRKRKKESSQKLHSNL